MSSIPARLRRLVTERVGQRCEYCGLTATGRATVAVLNLIRLVILGIRAEEIERGRHPPPTSEFNFVIVATEIIATRKPCVGARELAVSAIL